ncbi:Pycsar system effector family protein [Streptomyces sp. NPDC050703]|uniref:Pycsar system effector family protein n=1 Tax=Streptomyces sp. NPDC050703 TaxID=3157218 RepID=UPI00341D5A6F
MRATNPRPTAPRPAPAPDPGTGVAERLLADLRVEIARADSKAAVLVAALGVAAGVFSSLLARHGWSPAALSVPGSSTWWSGVLALAVALLSMLMAVLPRYDSTRTGWSPGAPLSYFGDIQRAARSGHLAQALAETEQAPLLGTLTALTETSRIALRKHQWMRVGLIAFAASALLLPGSLLIG